MKKVIIETPYRAETKKEIKENIRYARACVKDSLDRGEAPIASHLLYTQGGILRDEIKAERNLGIKAGLAWLEDAELHVFYIDRGFSEGMRFAYTCSRFLSVKREYRRLKVETLANQQDEEGKRWE